MFKPVLVAGVAAALLLPSLADAQSSGCQTDNGGRRTIGALIGAGIGALFGNAISEHGGKPGGTIIGGIGGGVAGAAISGSGNHCRPNQYGYYDNNGRWVPSQSSSAGYYDADGHWIDNVAGPAPVARAEPSPPPAQSADYDRRDSRAQGPWVDGHDLAAREAWLERDIRQRLDNGSIDGEAGREWMRRLRDIRRDDANARDENNRLPQNERADLERRLDDIAARLGEDRRAENRRDRAAPAY